MIEIRIDHETLVVALLALFLLRWFIDWRGGKAARKETDKLIEQGEEYREYTRDMFRSIWEELRADKKGEE